jgi:hypothetical protein
VEFKSAYFELKIWQGECSYAIVAWFGMARAYRWSTIWIGLERCTAVHGHPNNPGSRNL